jgi:DNA-binding CsgD family transcriptional regulator
MKQFSSATVLQLPQVQATQKSRRVSRVDFPGVTLDAYHLLAKKGDLTLGEIAQELDFSRDQAQATIAELASLKLIRETDDGRIVAIPHSQAIDDLLSEQALMLAHAVDYMSEGQRRLRALVDNRSLLDPSEASRITSTAVGDPGQRGMFELPGEAADSVSAMHPGGLFSDDLLRRSIARAEENLKRHVRMRVVHQSSVLRHPAMVSYLTELETLGCRVRLRDNLPFRLLLVDGTSAICAVPNCGCYLLKGERVMVLLNRIFETTWVDALPLERAMNTKAKPFAPVEAPSPRVPERRSATLSQAHEGILRLLAEGQTDQSIARSMGITTRTVTRRISEIYELLGVESRFQAGIAAKELGIV